MIAADDNAAIEDALAFYFECLDRGDALDEVSLVARFPQFAVELRNFFADQQQLNAKVRQLSSKSEQANRLTIRCPNCHQPTEVAVDSSLTNLRCGACGSRFSLVDPSAATTDAPTTLTMGRFRLIERLGVGAFGAVWKARDESLDRMVAVKIPRQGGMTSEEQEKFFREARAVAQLRHPNIVSVHEVGRDRESVYIVSDFVQGVTLADWLTGQQLTSREAAQLCVTIGDALEHAHQKGVVHRDLKPANIMIDGDGAPHLMDFGLARRDVGEVSITMEGHILGTPAYMSPEQAEGRAHTADRRSDVYSLGVILFQLLTGELPFRGNARMLLHQVINDEAPSPRKLNSSVNKDLETITLKCLEKESGRRYQSADDLAGDLRRFLIGEPIDARPIGSPERAVRWIRRNKIVSSLSALAAIALLSGTIVSTYFAFDAHRQANEALTSKQQEAMARKVAEARQREAETVTNFFVGAFAKANPSSYNNALTAADILNQAEMDLQAKLRDQPLTQASMLLAIGDSRGLLGLWKEALEAVKKGEEIREKYLGPDHPDTISSKRQLALAYRGIGRMKESTELLESVLAIRKKTLGEDHSSTIGTVIMLGQNYSIEGRHSEAIQALEKLLAELRKSGKDTIYTMESLAAAYRGAGQIDKSIALCEDALARRRKQNTAKAILLNSMAGLAASYYHARRYDDGIALYQETIAGQKEQLGPEHADTLKTIYMLATTYRMARRFDESIPVYEEVFNARKKQLGTNDPVTIQTAFGLLMAYEGASRFDRFHQLSNEILKVAVDQHELLNMIARHFATSKDASMRDGKRAIEVAVKACELTEYKNASYLDTLAAAYAETREFDMALKWEEKALLVVAPGNDKLRDTVVKTIVRYKDEKNKTENKPVGSQREY